MIEILIDGTVIGRIQSFTPSERVLPEVHELAYTEPGLQEVSPTGTFTDVNFYPGNIEGVFGNMLPPLRIGDLAENLGFEIPEGMMPDTECWLEATGSVFGDDDVVQSFTIPVTVTKL